ncbi:MAG: hypothetical protein HYW45_01445 [Candidatus Daviesbacteria bacterium]|nr:MAG: hypothetical protein HYW45_01445 [Candidatus Daviesbacteria bacterium]
MADKKETLEFDSVTVYDPGGEQMEIPISRTRMFKLIGLCTEGIITVHPRGQNILPPRQQMLEDFDQALMLALLFPDRIAAAMQQSFTERQFSSVQQALLRGETIKFNII